VLLATFNSSRFIAEQLASLVNNTAHFELHWLDDHSSDNTREQVRSCCRKLQIDLREWHRPARLRVPAAFFALLDQVEADAYLFCDHDDIWQPGKIDATLAALPVHGPARLCFSEPLVFPDGALSQCKPYFAVADIQYSNSPARAFWNNPAVGNTIGFNRALRDHFLPTSAIAREKAVMHDWWMYLLACSCGEALFLPGVPTTLYRQHSTNVFGARGEITFLLAWRRLQVHRFQAARQAEGFIEVARFLPQSPRLERLAACARLFAGVHQRQSAAQLIRLIRAGGLPADFARMILFAAASLLFDATPA
jgi:hypothetical protein